MVLDPTDGLEVKHSYMKITIIKSTVIRGIAIQGIILHLIVTSKLLKQFQDVRSRYEKKMFVF